MEWSELGVLITSHPKQQKYWVQGLGSWLDYPHHILLGMDDEHWRGVPKTKVMPPVKETFLTGEPAGTLGHFRGELEQMQMGGKILAAQGYKYIYKTAADTTCYRWRRLIDIAKVLKKQDFVLCGTAQIFGKLDSFNKCMEAWHRHFRCGGAELYFDSQIRAFEMTTDRRKGPWWEEVLGRIHVQGEHAINTGGNVMNTWINGQLWRDDYKHKDLARVGL